MSDTFPDARGSARDALRAINWFRKTERTEEAFYLRFERMPPERLQALLDWWATDDTWVVFRRVCSYWGAGRRRARRTPGDTARGLPKPVLQGTGS